jgi:hypothetical protein
MINTTQNNFKYLFDLLSIRTNNIMIDIHCEIYSIIETKHICEIILIL